MTITTPPHAGGPVPDGRNADHAGDTLPGAGARPMPDVPGVILAGAADWMLPPTMLAGAGRLQLRIVPGAVHFLPAERPAEVAEAARELFRRS